MAEFIGNDNKLILWDILSEQNLFEGIDAKHKYEIKDLFEQTILLVEKQGRGLSLIEKNKDVIKNMVISLESFKRQQQTPTVPRQYTNEELHKERQKAFEREVKRKQTEFDGLNRTIPEKIDFSDKPDEKLGHKIDLLLSETIASRERELNQVLQIQNPELAAKWIETGNGVNNFNNFVEFNDLESGKNVNLKIGEEAQIQETQIVNLDRKINIPQKVSFNESKNKTLNFLTESTPLSINNKRETTDNIIENNNIYMAINKKIDNEDIGLNLFKMLKKDETDNNIKNGKNEFEPIRKEETEKINANNFENNVRLDIDNLNKKITETNKSVEEISKSIDLINSRQEEIIFILKTMMNTQQQQQQQQ